MSDSKELVQSVDRAMVLLETLCRADSGISLQELAQAAHLPKSTAHRLLKTLIHHNLVSQDSHKSVYAPGLKLFELAYSQINSLSLRPKAAPFVAELARQTNETIHLAVLDDYEVVYIEKEETDHPIRMHSAIGKRSPVHCTGLGKAMLAYLSDQDLEAAVQRKGLTRYTPRTITSFQELKEHLALVRSKGYAIDDAEHEEEIRCVAAPVRDHRGEVIAAISLSVPSMRCNRQRIESFAPSVCHYADQISRQMGYVSAVTRAEEASK
jgi:IclR family KDG regulon transcriptional repressor